MDACVPGVGCTHGPLPCDDGQACTTDVCDESSGFCSNRDPATVCPAGLTAALGRCWLLGRFTSNEFGAPGRKTCDSARAERGLEYDPATATLVGSEGTDANCAFVLAALGVTEPFELPSSACPTGIGCFVTIDLDLNPPPVRAGRCAQPPTLGASIPRISPVADRGGACR